jgi:hypothetical protein
MKKIIKYADRILEIKPYNVSVERDLLLYSLGDEKDINEVLDILKDSFVLKNLKNEIIDYRNITFKEKLFIGYCLRQISISENLNLKFMCDCGNVVDRDVSIGNILEKSKDLPKEFNDVISDDYQDFFNENIDEMDILEFDKFCEIIDENKTKFNFTLEIPCFYCKKIHYKSLESVETLLNTMSENSLENFYNIVTKLVFHGKFDFNGIMKMYPFEKEVYLTQLNREIEEIQKLKR